LLSLQTTWILSLTFFLSDLPVVSFQLIFLFFGQFSVAHSKVSNIMATSLPVQPIVFIMYFIDAHDSLCKDVLACTTSAVADGAVDQIRRLQSELKVNLWADSKRGIWSLDVVLYVSG